MNTGFVIAAVKDMAGFEAAMKSSVDTVFFLYPDIAQLSDIIQTAHEKSKKLFIHIDLTSGLGKDKSGIEFAKNAGVDGIISTRANLIRAAKDCGLKTVQRFFIVDSRSVDTTVETLRVSKADLIEVMPGIAPKIIKKLKSRVDVPIIAGGLIELEEEVAEAVSAGAAAVSTGQIKLWN